MCGWPDDIARQLAHVLTGLEDVHNTPPFPRLLPSTPRPPIRNTRDLEERLVPQASGTFLWLPREIFTLLELVFWRRLYNPHE
ncbi:hypothetical protein RRG08_011584 [Elysia crispata]|uniref:Uncharacterized protein n=1 Tax=Elysia crispata TaxID=231223 RepID=A0AAE0XP37_9GAST|nr:hypothetical protein RRG08_011584 [Elysia crispata]